MDAIEKKNLKRRYLLWLYKAVKEEFDKIERKFTQLEIDKVLLAEMKALDKKKLATRFISDYQAYMHKKQDEGVKLKYRDASALLPEYYFLEVKLKAVENTIAKVLGQSGLRQIKALYERQMSERILRSTEH